MTKLWAQSFPIASRSLGRQYASVSSRVSRQLSSSIPSRNIGLHSSPMRIRKADRPPLPMREMGKRGAKVMRRASPNAGNGEVVSEGGSLEVRLPSHIGTSALHRFPLFWLRDHCPCPECTHPQTKQRQLDTFSIVADPTLTMFEPSADGLGLVWSDGHKSHFSWSWLCDHHPISQERILPQRFDFVEPSAKSAYPKVPYISIMSSDDGLHDYLSSIQLNGFCFVPGTPVSPKATQDLLERISFIRPTHYGGFWDFTSVSNPVDTAYTSLPLAAHTDTTYFTDPAGLQMFHMLSHTNGSGGESIFVDGFAAAKHMEAEVPDLYHALCDTPIVSHASGDPKAGLINNTAANFGYPVFTIHRSVCDNPQTSSLTQIRWNNDDRSPMTKFNSETQMRRWYAAAKEWSEILKMPRFELEIQLEPGCPVIFDNWRILHGRRGFTGERRVCGGYIGMDDFRARLRGLGRDLGKE